MSRADARPQTIFAKTQGDCHFCGNRLRLRMPGKYGGVMPSAWVIQRKRGRKDDIAKHRKALNWCMPSTRCESPQAE
ncbi:MAG: hypothetical protein JSU73_06520 [candidate division WOR-3 bacterium]|nr:MAG: hypothetical protein JSU73_06520 [candidate division WOR-3 bacterium]